MTISLTTPFNYDPGHGKPIVVCNEVKIVETRVNTERESGFIILMCKYGNGNGNFMPVDPRPSRHRIENIPAKTAMNEEGVIVEVEAADPKYDDFISSCKTAAANLLVMDEVSRHLYQWLLDEGIYSGTII